MQGDITAVTTPGHRRPGVVSGGAARRLFVCSAFSLVARLQGVICFSDPAVISKVSRSCKLLNWEAQFNDGRNAAVGTRFVVGREGTQEVASQIVLDLREGSCVAGRLRRERGQKGELLFPRLCKSSCNWGHFGTRWSSSREQRGVTKLDG